MKIINISKDIVLADRAEVANTFVKRLLGLLTRSGLADGQALILSPSNSIHSFFMRFTFDAVFLDKNSKVIAALSSFKPFRLSRIYFKAASTIELPEGVIKATDTQSGDTITYEVSNI